MDLTLNDKHKTRKTYGPAVVIDANLYYKMEMYRDLFRPNLKNAGIVTFFLTWPGGWGNGCIV